MKRVSKVWFRFSKSINDGEKVKFRWEQLPSYRFEEFLDFQMKHYVKHEVTLAIAGIPENPEAMEEYRQLATEFYKKPSCHTAICCVDDESNKIVGFNSLNMYKKGEAYPSTMQAKTVEMQRFFKFYHLINNLCPVPEILTRFGVNQYFDDAGLAIHPEYRGFRFTTEAALLRNLTCKENDVTLTGAWMSSTAVQNTAYYEGWDIIYEASSEEMEKVFGVKLPKTPQKYMYKIKKYL